MSHNKNVPSINVVTSETPSELPPKADSLTVSPISSSTGGRRHVRSPSDPNYLAPSPILVHPGSATSSTEDAPPSPTLSAVSSVHFQTSVDLRGRSPGDGISSLQAVQQHARKNSAASFQTVTEADHASQGVPPSSATSITAGPATAAPTEEGSTDKKRGDALATVAHINPVDDHTDPTPFGFKPNDLAALVDPKNLNDLEKMDGMDGLCKGLGTDRTRGLSAHSLGQGGGADGERSGGEGSFAASLSDRQRVYGTNSLPTRPSKTLLQLMWLALKDKVLVCGIAIATTFAWLCSFFPRFYCVSLQ
jgi:Ca2+-transporting ATPase